MRSPRLFCGLALLLLFATVLDARNEPAIVLMWPVDKPALRLTFDQFRQVWSLGAQSTFVSDVTVENLTDKQIPRAFFTVYLSDKNKVRIGEGLLEVYALEAGQSAKIQFQFNSVGVPDSLALSAKTDIFSPKAIPVRVISVPPGAKLKVDGQDSGTTPVVIRFAVGTHELELTKEGYAVGKTPLDVTADELPGGSITIELGGLAQDTLELRDGSIVLGDVMSLSMAEIVVRVQGKEQSYDRNQVKKIILVERQVTPQTPVPRPISH